MTFESCLPDGEIARWLSGGAAGAEIERWDRHIGQCPRCLARLGAAYRGQGGAAAPGSVSSHLTSVLDATLDVALAPAQPPAGSPVPGDAAGRYVPLRFLAEGGMGEVYLGEDRQTGQRVAIKRLRPNLRAADVLAIERFAREGELLARLDHPNIVKTLALLPGPPPAIVMEHVGGGSLRELLRSEPRLPLGRALRILLELSDALARAHHLGVIHRDLKPENVLLTEHGTPRLSDFGLARGGPQELTTPGMILGTIPYLSPEALRGQPADESADLWSLGVLAFELCCGVRPFQGVDVPSTLTAILQQPLPAIEPLCPGVPVALVDLLHRLLERDARQRLRSARQVGAELELIVAELSAHERHAHAGSAATLPVRQLSSPRRHGPRRRDNLPPETSTFVGRDAELASLSAQLADPAVRLLTIVGPGGVGKSRLALEASRRLLAAQGPGAARGVFLVDLAPLGSPELLTSAVAEALGYAFQSLPEPSVQLLDYLRDKQLLLLLDNFEHLLAAAELVHRLLLHAVDVKLLVTSREPLGLTAEVLLPLAGLSLPAAAEPGVLEQASAARLFLETARRLQPGLSLSAERAWDIVRICRAVQGMPLGIVLAASLSRLLSTREIADEVERSLDFLHSERVDLPLRQHSLRALFEHSWRLLAPAERSALAAVSVFRGGFSRAAAEAVAGASLGSLAALVNKSLLQRDPDSGRYDVHELVRQFAEHQLRLDGALHACTRDRYVDYYSRFLAQRRADGSVAQRRRVLRELEAERGNLRWSWQLMLEERRLDAVDCCIDALVLFNEARSSRREAEAQTAAALERFGPVTAAASARLRRVAGVAASACASACDDQDRTQEAGVLLALALELLDAAEHPRERAFALVQRGATQVEEGLAQRIAWIQAAVQLYRSLAEPKALSWALYRLGMVYYSGLGGLSQAVACLRESIAVQESVAGPAEVRPLTLVRLGSFLLRQGEPAEGYSLIQRGVLLAREQQEDGLAGCLQILAMVERERGEYAAGEAAAREALALMSELGRRVTWALITLGDLLAEQGRLDEAEAQYQVCLREHSGDIFAAHTARWCLGEVALARGQLKEARRLTEEALAGFERLGVGWGCVQALDTLAEAARQSGDLPSARRHFARACQVGLSAETHDVLLGVAAGIARCFADAGEHSEALQLLQVIEGQPAVPARVNLRLQPLRQQLGLTSPSSAERKDAADLRTALEHCVHRLR